MQTLAAELTESYKIKLSVATVYGGKKLLRFEESGVMYFLLPKRNPNTKYDKSLEPYWKNIIKDLRPDIIHIHGTEFAHGLSCMHACPDQRYIISIQGLVSVCSEYYYAGIRVIDSIKNITINDIIRKDTIFHGKRDFVRRGKLEYDYIKRCVNIIGRTNWDYAHVKTINPSAEYHFCNEMLRGIFYECPGWDINEKNEHSIFLSQAGYPLKGLHQVLKAMDIVRKYYPQVLLRIGGSDIIRKDIWVERLSGYGAYIRSLIKKLKLDERVTYTGPLSEERMAVEYRNAHVFVCPSSIENSSNSLGEAQIIGTPCVGSFVGGLPDMIKDGETGLLYRFEDYVMLAHQIMKFFGDDELAKTISYRSRSVASARHNREVIRERIMDIYSTVSANKKHI